MKTKNFQLSDKELSLLCKVLSSRVLDLRLKEMTSVRVGISAKSIHKEIVFTDSILSKLNNI